MIPHNSWQPMDLAPRDGTPLILLVQDGDFPTEDALDWRTIGFNNFDNDGEDKWLMAGWCWSHDHFVEGDGKPIGWQPMPDKPEASRRGDRRPRQSTGTCG